MIDILIVKDNKGEPIEWLFERGVEDPAIDFDKAKAEAERRGIYIGERRDDIITDFNEFEDWLTVSYPETDALTLEVRAYAAALDDYNAVNKQYEEIYKERKKQEELLDRMRKLLIPKLTDKVKTVDGRMFTARANAYQRTIVELEQA